MTLILSSKWSEKLLMLPESGMGYQRINVRLKSGKLKNEKPGRAQELNRDLMDVQHRLAELNPEWEQQATRLAALE